MNREKILDVSWGTIFKIALGFLLVYLLFLIKDILILIIFALIVSILFEPVIRFLQKLRLPRVLAVSLAYLLILGSLSLFLYFLARSFIPEIKQFTESFSFYFEQIAPPLKSLGLEIFENVEIFTTTIEGWLREASFNIFTALAAFFGGLFSAFTIFSIAFFLSLEGRWAEKVIKILFPKKHEEIALSLWQKSQNKISNWFGVRIACCFFVGLASFLTLKLFKVDYAFSLGLFSGLIDIIPFLGPFIAGILITILVSLENWFKALFILIAFILIQQIENSLVIPILSKKFIGLPSVLVAISLIIGGKLWGLPGIIFSLPLAGILFEFLGDYLEKKKEESFI